MNSLAMVDLDSRDDAESRSEHRARVFLLPGLLGDEPKLMHLRHRLAGQIEFVLLKLPDIAAPASLLSSLHAIGQVIVDEIVHRQPAGPVSIAGYSFGASVALEVATQLRRLDRSVGYLCILDGAFKVDDLRRPFRAILRDGLTPEGALAIARRIVRKVRDQRYLLRAKRFPDALTTSPLVRHAYISRFRNVALDGWQPKACGAQGILILSTSLGPENRPRWLDLCPNLKLVQLSSNHHNLLIGESLDLVVSAIGQDFALWTATR